MGTLYRVQTCRRFPQHTCLSRGWRLPLALRLLMLRPLTLPACEPAVLGAARRTPREDGGAAGALLSGGGGRGRRSGLDFRPRSGLLDDAEATDLPPTDLSPLSGNARPFSGLALRLSGLGRGLSATATAAAWPSPLCRLRAEALPFTAPSEMLRLAGASLLSRRLGVAAALLALSSATSTRRAALEDCPTLSSSPEVADAPAQQLNRPLAFFCGRPLACGGGCLAAALGAALRRASGDAGAACRATATAAVLYGAGCAAGCGEAAAVAKGEGGPSAC